MNAAMGIAERLRALESAVAELQTGVRGKEAPAPTPPVIDSERLAQLLGNSRLASVLARAGYASPAAVAEASDEQLLAIDGVAEKALKLIREKVTA
jgi:hypothetical protein